MAHNEEQRDTPQLELKDTTTIDNLGPNRNDDGIEWLDVEEPLDLVDISEESVYESLIKEMPKCSLNYDFRIKKGDPRNLKSTAMRMYFTILEKYWNNIVALVAVVSGMILDGPSLEALDTSYKLRNLAQAQVNWDDVETLIKDEEIANNMKEQLEKLIERDKWKQTSLSYFWGTPALTPAGVALYKDGDNKQSDQGTISYNWVEGLNYPLSQGSLNFCLDQYPMVRDMRTSLEEYGVHQERIAKSIFGAMSQNLTNCEENEGYLSLSTGILRVYRYPRSFFDKSTKVWGMEAHTDSSVVTILNQYEVAGLQVLSPIDEWIDAKPIPNTLLVHLGDMMQAISDDKYKSVKHRVMVNRERERISVGYFVFPDNDCVIRSSNYKPFTYLDFRNQVQHDIKNLGVKVGLSRFKLNKDFYI
ncbi:gibberellin 2-beta-dioxygenase 8 [Tanacetum coccineum]